MAKGGEPFTTLGSREEAHAQEGEIIYRDDVEVLCKAWNWRECDKSKITEESKNVSLVIEGLEHTRPGEIVKALKELNALIQKYCGGKQSFIILIKRFLKCAMLQTLRIACAVDIPEPDYHSHESFKTRKQKLKEIRNMGMDPYPINTSRPIKCAPCKTNTKTRQLEIVKQRELEQPILFELQAVLFSSAPWEKMHSAKSKMKPGGSKSCLTKIRPKSSVFQLENPHLSSLKKA